MRQQPTFDPVTSAHNLCRPCPILPRFTLLPPLQTNLSDLPLRASNPAVAQSAAMSQDLLDLQERMKKIQNLGAAS